jgi:hypothetical protein
MNRKLYTGAPDIGRGSRRMPSPAAGPPATSRSPLLSFLTGSLGLVLNVTVALGIVVVLYTHHRAVRNGLRDSASCRRTHSVRSTLLDGEPMGKSSTSSRNARLAGHRRPGPLSATNVEQPEEKTIPGVEVDGTYLTGPSEPPGGVDPGGRPVLDDAYWASQDIMRGIPSYDYIIGGSDEEPDDDWAESETGDTRTDTDPPADDSAADTSGGDSGDTDTSGGDSGDTDTSGGDSGDTENEGSLEPS